ncbi:MAG: hypothetical protein U5R30_12590 [Deltaproteobacteria bacterium]|nr:hypothetical protein [Deltaproteobacteria bacterium]
MDNGYKSCMALCEAGRARYSFLVWKPPAPKPYPTRQGLAIKTFKTILTTGQDKEVAAETKPVNDDSAAHGLTRGATITGGMENDQRNDDQ